MSQSYEIEGFRVGIRTTSPSFGEWLNDALASYRLDEEVASQYSLVIADDAKQRGSRKGFNILYRGTAPIVRTLHLPTLGRALLAELESFTFQERKDAVFVQALAMDIEGSFVLVPAILAPSLGRFGRRLEKSGIHLGSSTTVALDPRSGRVTPPANLLAVSEECIARLTNIDSQNHATDRLTVDDVSAVDVLFVGGPQTDSPLSPISKGLAVHKLAGNALNLAQLGKTGLHALARLVEGSTCYGVPGGNARETLDFLVAAVKASRN